MHYDDFATLRRLLVDEGYLDREAGEYWRSAGRSADDALALISRDVCGANWCRRGYLGMRLIAASLVREQAVNTIVVCRKLVVMTMMALSGLGVLVATPAAFASGAAAPAPTGDAFYVPPEPLAKAKAGAIIRSTPIADAPRGARAWKILYHSRAVDGRDIAVSGVVITPTGKAPRGGRVVVSWAHGATGLADISAPSKQPDVASGTSGAGIGEPQPRALVPMVQTFLDAGYVIAATDYEGLGTPGLHPFLVGESEGRSVLDGPAPPAV